MRAIDTGHPRGTGGGIVMFGQGGPVKVFAATRPVDFCKGIDGLGLAVQDRVMRISSARLAALFEGLDWRWSDRSGRGVRWRVDCREAQGALFLLSQEQLP